MNCVECDYILSEEEERLDPVPIENKPKKLCFRCISELGQELIDKEGDPFHGTDNFNALLDDMIATLVEFQSRHGLELSSVMALTDVVKQGLNMAEKSMLGTFIKEMKIHNIDTDGGPII